MNGENDLLKRLLKLYPVKLVKEHFEPEESTQIELIPEVVNNNPNESIRKFAVDNHLNTKQHIYFYTLSDNFNRINFNLDGIDLILEEEVYENDIYYFKFLPKIKYDVVLGNPIGQDTIEFIQPITVTVSHKLLVVHATIMECL